MITVHVTIQGEIIGASVRGRKGLSPSYCMTWTVNHALVKRGSILVTMVTGRGCTGMHGRDLGVRGTTY